MTQLKILKSYPFLKTFTGKKDGKNQVMIRLKIGLKQMGKTINAKEIDLQLISNQGEIIKVTRDEFKNRNSNKDLMLRYYEIDALAGKAVFLLSNEGKEINRQNLFKYVYAQNQSTTDVDEFIDNDDVQKIFGHPVPVKVWENFISQPYTDETFGEPVLFEELEDIANAIESEYYEEKNLKKIEKMDYNERYEKGLYNKNNIFECFGFCWSKHPKKNEALIADSYKSLLLRLHDYRFNENPPENASDFNDNWIDDFLKFLVEQGYSSYRPQNYNPFNFNNFKIKLINADRKPYRFSGFEKLVKHLKRYIFLMQKYKIVSYNRDSKFISAKDYIGRNVQTNRYTRREHSLTNDEFKLLCSTDFKDDILNRGRDMFILSTLGGGFRGEELFNHELTLEKRDNQYILQIFNSKTSTSNVNPVFGELIKVIERNYGKLPEFLPKDEFRNSLKIIADKLNFNRVIVSPNTFLNSDDKQTREVLKDIFSIYFARKTFITYLDSQGMPDDDIIEFSSHSKIDTLKHYKGNLSITGKLTALKKHNLI